MILWLRDHGVEAKSAIHELRKEHGSIVCQTDGIFAASMQLRHSDIRITRGYYVDKKKPATVDLGAMLEEEKLKTVNGD